MAFLSSYRPRVPYEAFDYHCDFLREERAAQINRPSSAPPQDPPHSASERPGAGLLP